VGNELVKREVVSMELMEVITPSGHLIHLEGRDGLFQLVNLELTVPAELTYKIKGGEKGEVGFVASFYDLTAVKMGLQFGDPKTIYEDKEKVRVLVPVEYWNREGKKVRDAEEYEVDCQLLYEKARFGWEDKYWDKAKGKYVITDRAKIKVIRDPKHPENPPQIIVELPDKAEAELYENFLTLRRNRLPKAITCAHRRLAQRALGIKKVEANTNSDGWNKAIKVRMYSMLPAEADRKVGIQAISDLIGEDIPPEKEERKKLAAKPTEVAAAPAPATSPAETATSKEEKEEKREGEGEEKKEEKKETAKTDASEKPVCAFEGCGAEVAKVVADYSQKFYRKILCRKHQPKKA